MEKKEIIEQVMDFIFEDIKKLREQERDAAKRLGVEFMSLNSLCNAAKTLAGAED